MRPRLPPPRSSSSRSKSAMSTEDKYARLLNPGESWFQFGCFHLSEWATKEGFPQLECLYNKFRVGRDLPEWPVTLFGPIEDIRLLRLGRLFRMIFEGTQKEKNDKTGQKPITRQLLRAMKEAGMATANLHTGSPDFKLMLEDLETSNYYITQVCFAWTMAKVRKGPEPGTPEFLEEIQKMILTRCDRRPDPAWTQRPLMAVTSTHPKLDTRATIIALNLAQMKDLIRVGNVRACKNWKGEKREKLREYRKNVFLGCLTKTEWSRIPAEVLLMDYDLELFDSLKLPHKVVDDTDDGQEDPPRCESPDTEDPFWKDVFRRDQPPAVSEDGLDEDENIKKDAETAEAAKFPEPVPGPGKNSARNKKKAQKKRLRKVAEMVGEGVVPDSAAATPAGPVEGEAARPTTPAPPPAALTEKEQEQKRKAKAKAKKQRRKERQAATNCSHQESDPEDEPVATNPEATDFRQDEGKETMPPPSRTVSHSPSPPSSATLGRSRPPSPELRHPTPKRLTIPTSNLFSALSSSFDHSPTIPTPNSSASDSSPSPPRPIPLPISPLPTSHPSLPRFWALDVEEFEEDTFLRPRSSSPADLEDWRSSHSQSEKEGCEEEEEGMIRVRPMIWWAAADEWVPLNDGEYLVPAGTEVMDEEELGMTVPWAVGGWAVPEEEGAGYGMPWTVPAGDGKGPWLPWGDEERSWMPWMPWMEPGQGGQDEGEMLWAEVPGENEREYRDVGCDRTLEQGREEYAVFEWDKEDVDRYAGLACCERSVTW